MQMQSAVQGGPQENQHDARWAIRQLTHVRREINCGNYQFSASQIYLIYEAIRLDISHVVPMLTKLQEACLQEDLNGALDTMTILMAELRMLKDSSR